MTLWTTRPAAIMGMDDVAGSIAPGKSADFVVLNSDLHTNSVDAVSEIQPEQTWFRGTLVYDAP